jgi:glycosyltransferase involved in cell wall biosynthesis
MIVGVDARSLQYARGVTRYVAPTLAALADAMPDDEFRLLAPGRTSIAAAPARANVTVVRPRAEARRYYARSALLGRPRLDRALGGVDVFWLPASHPGSVSEEVPLVLTVHDLSFDTRPQDFTRYERLNHRITNARAQCSRADRILVTTAAVRDEVVAAYGVSPAKIDVIAPGVARPAWEVPDPKAVAEARLRYGLPARYVLQVGALEPRKRPDVTARAAARVGVAVAFAGEGPLAKALRGAPGAHLLGHVPDGDLDLLYAGAAALTYPSMLEGYGFPPQEAALRGTPAVVSDLPALRETLGDGALFIPPGDEDALTVALAELGGDDALRRALAGRAAALATPRTHAAAATGIAEALRRARDARA